MFCVKSILYFDNSIIFSHFEGLPDLLEMVTREVLRSQPQNIVEFISNLLTNLVSENTVYS